MLDNLNNMGDDFPYQVYWSDGSKAGRYARRGIAFAKAGVIGGYFRFEPRGRNAQR